MGDYMMPMMMQPVAWTARQHASVRFLLLLLELMQSLLASTWPQLPTRGLIH